MSDEQKTPADGEQPTDTSPTAEQETVEQPAPEPVPATSPSTRTRNTLIAGGAGLALVGGLVGFGIGHASADGGDGNRFDRVSQYAPGEGRPDFRNGERPGRPSDGDRGRHFRDGESDGQAPSES
jgi:hypothetical protein